MGLFLLRDLYLYNMAEDYVGIMSAIITPLCKKVLFLLNTVARWRWHRLCNIRFWGVYMKKLFIIFALVCIQGFSDPLCLSQATNYEIGNEIWRRLDLGFGVGESFQILFNCESNAIAVERVDLFTGEVKKYNEYAYDCVKYRDLFDTKLQNFTKGKLIAWCTSYSGGYLVKLLITAKGELKQVSKSNSSNCLKEADAINAKL